MSKSISEILDNKTQVAENLRQELDTIKSKEENIDSVEKETILKDFETWLSDQILQQSKEILSIQNLKHNNLNDDMLKRAIALVKDVHHALKNMPDTTTSRGGKLRTSQLKARANKIINDSL